MSVNELNGKRALVCGASRGIGRACAEALAANGALVAVLARKRESVEAAARSLPGDGHRALAVDMNDTTALAAGVRDLLESFAPVHVLVNNSGGPAPGPVHTADAEAFLPVVRQHLLAAHTLVQAVLPGMRTEGYGRIVNIISTSVKQPIPGLGVSNTVRGAVANWAKTLAAEVAADGITVNNVLPGATRTDRLASIISRRAEREGSSESEVEAAILKEIPAKRFGEPGEIANAVAFLSSPRAGYITGINVPVDGGRTGCL